MPAVHRQGDANDGGGVIDGVAQGTVYVNGQLASIDGSSVSGHGLGEHSNPFTANGSATVFIGSIPVNRQGDADTCGDGRADGSPNVFANDGASVSTNGAGASAGVGDNVIGESTPGEIIALGPNISSETAKAAAVAMSRAVVSTVFDVNATAKYPNLPYGADNSGSTTASIAIASTNEVAPTGEFALTNQDGLALSMNYQDKILNSPAMKKRFPAWPGLPYGGNNA